MKKHFCNINPFCYLLSVRKEIFKRNLKDAIFFLNIASQKQKQKENLNYTVKVHDSVLLRKLHGVDMKLQENKVTNISLACDKINGIVIHPGQTFSFWKTVGNTTKKKGYKEGLVISSKDGLSSEIGGGLCQMANMIHYLVLNSPLDVSEIHHHTDALFPDDNRTVPFGTGTSISYNYVDYRFKNNTNQDFQISVCINEDKLHGELHCEYELPYTYELIEENHHFKKENDKYYRNSKVYKIIKDKKTKKEISKELVLDNHSEVMYDYNLIPKEQIRE